MKDWFPHDYYASKDLAVIRLLRLHGAYGYGTFWATIEVLHSNTTVDLDALYDVLCHTFCLHHPNSDNVQQVLDDMVSLGLIHIREDGTVYSRRVEANKEARDAIAETKRAAATARWTNAKQQQSNSNAHAMPKHNTTKQNTTVQRTSSAPVDPVYDLPCTADRVFHVERSDVQQMQELYPAVDIFAELRKMKGWLLANAQRRKTPRGMPRFIHAWLSKQQDTSHGNTTNNKVGERGSKLTTQQYDEQIRAITESAAGISAVHPDVAELRQASATH